MAQGDMREESRDCKFCGNTFQAKRSRQVHCSTECARHFHNRRDRQRDRKGEYWHSAPTLQCQGCGSDFKPKRTDRTKYCSRECAFEAKKVKPKEPRPLSSKVYFRNCKNCTALFTARGSLAAYCSAQCRPKPQYVPVIQSQKVCMECGNTFIPNSRDAAFCSKRCRKKPSKRIEKIRARTRLRCVAVESVSPLRVFMRDGWQCQLCGVRTPKSLRGKHKPNSPELDHIVPLSRGGEHSYRNTQLLCRSCNQIKSNKIIGQLRLFG